MFLAALAMRGKAFSGLLFFFAIPIAMIGHTSIPKVTFQDEVVTIDKTADQVLADPANTALQSALRPQLTN